MRGLFITLEGGEGTGKSTLQRHLAQALKSMGIDLLLTREPGGTPLAEDIRNLVLYPREKAGWTPLAEALLMNAARAEHLANRIVPALSAGQWVLCDRFADSTRAYQGAAETLEDETLAQLEEVVLANTAPDLTFLLDADPEALLARRAERGDVKDQFEARGLTFHRAVRRRFLKIAQAAPERCVIIDALKPPEDVVNTALHAMKTRFPKWVEAL